MVDWLELGRDLLEWLPWIFLMFLLTWLVAYFIPLVIALVNNHPHKVGVALLNLLTGWTVLGWWAALAWAVLPLTARRAPVEPREEVPLA